MWRKILVGAVLVLMIADAADSRSTTSGKVGEGTYCPAAPAAPSSTPAPSPGPAPAASGPAVARFTTYKCVDQVLGLEAFRMLLPQGWKFSGGVRWTLVNPAMPAEAAFKVSAPSGGYEFEVFPPLAFAWKTDQMFLASFPPGALYYGATVLAPVDASTAMRQIVLPRYRGATAGVSDLKVVSIKPAKELGEMALAELRAQLPPQIGSSAEGVSCRIEYQQNGRQMEEEIFAVVRGWTMVTPSMMGAVQHTNWTVDYLFSAKAEKGRLEAAAPFFQAIMFSFRINPQWYGRYQQVIEALAQQEIRHVNAIGELSRQISRNNQQISDGIMRSYEARSAATDRMAQNWSDYTRGVERYNDPRAGGQVELPSGYSHVWATANGEYVLSNSPSYNPNQGSNLHWEELGRAR